MSLLTCVQDAMALLKLGKPTQVATSTDPQVMQFVAMAQREVDETYPLAQWRNSRIDLTITGDDTTTLWQIPVDWERTIPGAAFWSSRYPSIPLIGPITEEEMLRLRALPVRPIRPVWRLIGGMIEIWPALSLNEVCRGVYYSSYPISSLDCLTRYKRWTNDSDFPLFPESILLNGLLWRWKASNGLAYAEDFRTYQRNRDLKMAHELGARTLNLSDIAAIPENQWPGVVTVVSP